MRRDFFLGNFSGAVSLLSGCAIDDVIADHRKHDRRFVAREHAVLYGLVGDDSAPVRVVVDEPLTADEDAQWVARVRRRLDVPDGRVLVMGGFDPRDLESWQGGEETMGTVEVVELPPGRWDVDVYTHTGSMNGRCILEGADLAAVGHPKRGEPLGAWFRASHPGAPLPMWLAQHAEMDPSIDPGHEDDWSDVPAAVREGRLAIDLERRSFVGFLFHLTPAAPGRVLDDVDDEGWIDPEAGKRAMEACPLGLPSTAPDHDTASTARGWAGEADVVDDDGGDGDDDE